MARILLIATHGSEDPTRAGLPFLFAKGEVEEGHRPEVILAGDGAVLVPRRSRPPLETNAISEKIRPKVLTSIIFAYTIKITAMKEPHMATPTTTQVENTIAQECLAVRMRMLNRVITNVYDDALRPLGVKTSQLNILVAAKRAELARPAEICHILQLDTSTLSRNVERMKARGWLEVVPDEDARAQPFRLTARGKKLLERSKPAWEQAQRKATELLGADAIGVISEAVMRIRSGEHKA